MLSLSDLQRQYYGSSGQEQINVEIPLSTTTILYDTYVILTAVQTNLQQRSINPKIA